jgi:hypothetical protein
MAGNTDAAGASERVVLSAKCGQLSKHACVKNVSSFGLDLLFLPLVCWKHPTSGNRLLNAEVLWSTLREQLVFGHALGGINAIFDSNDVYN